MRALIGIIFSFIAGLGIAGGLLFWQLDQLFHTPEPLQNIASEGESGHRLYQEVPDMIAQEVTGSLPGPAQGPAQEMITDTAGGISADPRFDQAWTASLEETRTGWLAGLAQIRQAPAEQRNNPEDVDPSLARVQLEVGPVASVSATILAEQINEATAGLFGRGIDQLATAIPQQLSVDTGFPSQDLIRPAEMAWLEDSVQYFAFVLGAAVLALVLSLLFFRSGHRWAAWMLTGLVVVASSVALRMVVDMFVDDAVSSAAGTSGAGVVEALMDGVSDWAQPQLLYLMIAGGVLAVLGIIGGFVSAATHSRQ